VKGNDNNGDGNVTRARKRAAIKSKLAAANASSKKIKKHGVMGTWISMLKSEWLRLAEETPTSDFKEKGQDYLMNVGVMAALLFTMVTISSPGLGGELETNYGVTKPAAEHVYTVFACLAQVFLMLTTMHSFTMYMVMSQCTDATEAFRWRQKMGHKLTVPYAFLIIGLAFYVVSQVWVAFTLLVPAVFFPYLAFFVLVIVATIFLLFAAVQALYHTKYEIGQGVTVDMFDEEPDEDNEPQPVAVGLANDSAVGPHSDVTA